VRTRGGTRSKTGACNKEEEEEGKHASGPPQTTDIGTGLPASRIGQPLGTGAWALCPVCGVCALR
jgi:hypothetical protein